MHKKLIFIVSLLVVCYGFAGAAEKKAKSTPPPMDPEMQKMMEQSIKNGAPNEKHKVLDPLIGKWNHTVRMWMTPQTQPQESKGSNENKWILGGRFIYDETTGISNTQGQIFQGIGITGYDNIKAEYITIWIDNMGTGIMSGPAQYDTASKMLSGICTISGDPMTGEKNKPFRFELKLIDNNHYTYTGYTKDKDGKEFKSLKVSYERAK